MSQAKSAKEVAAMVAVLLVYGALALGALVGFIVYLVREMAGMALVYLTVLSLLIGLAVYLGRKANEDEAHARMHDPPVPPAIMGLRQERPPGSGNIGRRHP